jgi:hypothetical protein
LREITIAVAVAIGENSALVGYGRIFNVRQKNDRTIVATPTVIGEIHQRITRFFKIWSGLLDDAKHILIIDHPMNTVTAEEINVPGLRPFEAHRRLDEWTNADGLGQYVTVRKSLDFGGPNLSFLQ